MKPFRGFDCGAGIGISGTASLGLARFKEPTDFLSLGYRAMQQGFGKLRQFVVCEAGHRNARLNYLWRLRHDAVCFHVTNPN